MNSVIFRPAPACLRHARNKFVYCLILWVIGSVAVFSPTFSEQALGASFIVDTDSPTVMCSLSGVVFYDSNQNGKLDTEWAISGGEVDLYMDGSLIATTTVSSNGQYYFTGLNPGTYSVYNKTSGDWLAVPGHITNISGSAVTTGLGSANADNSQIDSIILSAGDQARLYNFGAQYYPIQLLSKRLLTASAGDSIVQAVPEPATAVTLGFALIAIFFMVKRKRWRKI